MTEVVHSRQDCGPPPIGHGLSGQDSSSYRETDGGRTGIRDASANEKRKVEDSCPTSAPGIGPARADDMLLLPSAWTYEAGVPTEAWIPGF